jgi:hypothetical protein
MLGSALSDATFQEAAVIAGKGWTWTWQRCGRYKYRKVLVHTTNPDHLVPSTPSLTDIPPLQVTPLYRRDDGFTMDRSPK